MDTNECKHDISSCTFVERIKNTKLNERKIPTEKKLKKKSNIVVHYHVKQNIPPWFILVVEWYVRIRTVLFIPPEITDLILYFAHPPLIRVANGQYELGQRIGKFIKGSVCSGGMYEATHVETGHKVAVKLEKANTRHPQLQDESYVYKHMKHSIGVPCVYFYGQEEEYFVLVMDLLGPSLEDLFNYCGRHFSLKTILLLAQQMLDRIESVHSFEFIHRDIEPRNFLIGLKSNLNVVHIIDFGLSKRYINRFERRHIPFIEGKSLTGVRRYASINTHLGYEQSRRDDLEQLGYVLMYFIRGGKLPWQGLKAKSKTQRNERISKVKREITIESLCYNSPKQFAQYLRYCRKLDFNAKPDYKYLKNLFKDLFKKKGYINDGRYDWIIKATKISSTPSNSNKISSHHNTHNTHTKDNKHPTVPPNNNQNNNNNNNKPNNYTNNQNNYTTTITTSTTLIIS